MKIGILTYHDGVNFGGYLQTYCMQQTLNKLGYQNTIINYKNPLHAKVEFRSLFFTKRPRIFFGNLSKYIKFKRAHKRLDISAKVSNANEIEKEGVDIVIVGSDELWNFKNDFFGYDGIYYGEGLESVKRIAYAGCVGKVTLNDIFPNGSIEGLRSFHALSARDTNTQKIVQDLTQRECEFVLDPTFLSDASAEVILPDEKNYIAFYGIYLSDEHQRQLRDFSVEKGKRVISIGYYHAFADESIIALDPFEWMGYIKAADYVVTNMFHGTVFSILFERTFVSFGSAIRTNKLASLLEQFEMSQRLILDETSSLMDVLDTPPDYKRASDLKQAMLEKSCNYLQNALESCIC